MWQVRSAGVQRTIVTLRGEQDDGLGQSPAGRKIPTAPVLLTRVRMLRSFAIMLCRLSETQRASRCLKNCSNRRSVLPTRTSWSVLSNESENHSWSVCLAHQEHEG